MSQRERQASGGVTDVVPRSAVAVSPRPSPPVDHAPPRPPSWEEVFRAATPAQRQELLAAAARQGLLYAGQLPATVNGAGSDHGRGHLQNLLHGHTNSVAPAIPAAVPPFDESLDDVQRDAVARALSTPDLCLIQGGPGTGKSRVITEMVRQATARGERVLLAAPAAPALDRVLETVVTRDGVCAARAVGKDESVEALSPLARGLTFAVRARRLREEVIDNARKYAAETVRRAERLRRDESAWPVLADLGQRLADLSLQFEKLAGQRAQVAAEVEAEAASTGPATPFRTAWNDLLQEQRAAAGRLEAERTAAEAAIETQQQAEADLIRQVEGLQPLARAKESGRWWSSAWWKATFTGDVVHLKEELQSRQQQIHAALEEATRRRDKVLRDLEEAKTRQEAARARKLREETGRRQEALAVQEAALEQERTQLRDKWHESLRRLDPSTPVPAAESRTAVEAAEVGWVARCRAEDEGRELAAGWLACLEDQAEQLPGKLLHCVNLVAATTAGIHADERFGDHASPRQFFDLLIVDEAQLVTESEFLSVARRARRWVLVGEPAVEGESTEAPVAPPRGRGHGPGRSSASLRPGFFQRAWDHLHPDPRRLPYSWDREAGRLRCRLRPVPPERRGELQAEAVADADDIELRILAGAQGDPVLAEIVFPERMAIAEATGYVFRELDELALPAAGNTARWLDAPERVMLRLAATAASCTTPVDLAPGVRAQLVARGAAAPGESDTYSTCCVEFDSGVGWSRSAAEAWVDRHLNLRDLGRTARLDTPHRQEPDLARVVADLLRPDGESMPAADDRPGRTVVGRTAAVEFIPVPALAPERGGSGSRLRQVRGGAGLEQDLSDSRQRDRLPAELRPQLPDRGIVNYLEAQAVVKALVALVEQQPAPSGVVKLNGTDPANHRGGRPTVAVIALQPAQAELIRRLAQAAPVLTRAAFDLRIDVPSAFRQRECQTVLVSLTRSHTHRAVPFGDSPQALALALTRATERLLVFGDPGTLVRRTQWQGRLDHLDEAAATRERHLLAQLVRYLQGQGAHANGFHLREGSGA